MKTETQYSDLVGTVAADISDHFEPHNQLDSLLPEIYNAEQYLPVGFRMKIDCDVELLCRDMQNECKNSLIPIKISCSLEEFFSYFKRFNLCMVCNGYKGCEIDEDNAL